ncbi:hypothetical protein I3843_06G042300 [Carya illinoinensis]|nr:hypothetical protein I3843_06G042300 [Carya illinoinensis]
MSNTRSTLPSKSSLVGLFPSYFLHFHIIPSPYYHPYTFHNPRSKPLSS